ncbi:MAG: AmmeMemoRadiSam system protein A [Thermoleophilia bacterium]|nr:AmmeMemoRadiSam system protein A [Thermoleophilia bacterium]
MSGHHDSPQPDPLVALARKAIEDQVCEGTTPAPELPADAGPPRAGVFVSLHREDGALRGCIGTFLPTKSTLAEEVVSNAVAAATHDPRFLPVQERELEGLHVSVDVLEPPEEVSGPEDLDPACYGIIVRTDDGRQALLLPDLEGVDTVESQVRLTCRKGHIDPRLDRYRLYRFRVTRHT